MSILEEALSTDVVGGGHPLTPRVNLLPPEIAELRRFRRVQCGLGAGVLASIAMMGLLYAGAVGSARDAEAELSDAKAQGAATQAEQAKYAEATAVYARADAAELMLSQAMGQEVRYSTLLQSLATSVPDEVWLKSIVFNQTPTVPSVGSTTTGIGTVTFTGVGFEHDDVATWLESLPSQEGFANSYLTSSTQALIGDDVTADFASTVVLTPDALSGRYAPKAGS